MASWVALIVIIILVVFVEAVISNRRVSSQTVRSSIELLVSLLLAIASYWIVGQFEVTGNFYGLNISALSGFAVFVISLFYFRRSHIPFETDAEKYDHLKGLWTYELETESESTPTMIVGAFQVSSTNEDITVPIGRAYHHEIADGKRLLRGTWSSIKVSFKGDRVWIYYEMSPGRGKDKPRGGQKYSSILDLKIQEDNKLVGNFHDLGERNEFWGTIEAIKSSRKNFEEITDMIQRGEQA